MDLKKPLWVSIILSLVVVALPLTLYWWYVGRTQVISTNHEDWAFFGSFLAGVYTAIASFGSVGTLIFLIFQNYSEKEQQDRLTNAKIEILGFEKYQSHRLLFDKLIDEIENTAKIEFQIIERHDLYRKIFPQNSLETCSYKIDLDKQYDSHPLVEALATQQRLSTCLKSDSESENIGREIVQDIVHLQDFFNVEITRSQQDYDFIHRPSQKVVVNANELEQMIALLWKFSNEILEFTGNKPFDSVGHMVGTSFVTNSILKYAELAKTSHHETFVLHQVKI